jgi:hypothetical protein
MSDRPRPLTPINRDQNLGIGESGVKIDKAHRDYSMWLPANPKTRVHDYGQLPID